MHCANNGKTEEIKVWKGKVAIKLLKQVKQTMRELHIMEKCSLQTCPCLTSIRLPLCLLLFHSFFKIFFTSSAKIGFWKCNNKVNFYQSLIDVFESIRIFPRELWIARLRGFESSMNMSTAPRPKCIKYYTLKSCFVES